MHFDNICAIKDTTSGAQKILPVRATGAATRWVRTNARWLSQDGQTWSEVRNEFGERFTDDDMEEKIM